METNYLRSFLLVVESGSMSEAARRLARTPAAVAQQMRALERELHASLLARSGRTVQPTEAGHKLVGRARALLREWGDIQAWVGKEQTGGELVLGTINTALHSLLPDILARFLPPHPPLPPTPRPRAPPPGGAGGAGLGPRGGAVPGGEKVRARRRGVPVPAVHADQNLRLGLAAARTSGAAGAPPAGRARPARVAAHRAADPLRPQPGGRQAGRPLHARSGHHCAGAL